LRKLGGKKGRGNTFQTREGWRHPQTAESLKDSGKAENARSVRGDGG